LGDLGVNGSKAYVEIKEHIDQHVWHKQRVNKDETVFQMRISHGKNWSSNIQRKTFFFLKELKNQWTVAAKSAEGWVITYKIKYV
jgi:hypothetical protein